MTGVEGADFIQLSGGERIPSGAEYDKTMHSLIHISFYPNTAIIWGKRGITHLPKHKDIKWFEEVE
ncbi:MAG: hypothetical protein V1804_01310 [Patescibacteria group bacterium]